MKIRNIAFLGLLAGSLLSTPAHADRLPHPGSADSRVKTLTYHDNDVYRLEGHYGFTTAIEFSPQESVETISLGDSESWQVMRPSRPNVLFVKPLEADAQTNMTVLTTGHVYTFEMSAHEASSPRAGELTFRLKFTYPDENSFEFSNAGFGNESGPGFPGHGSVSSWNFSYSYSGARNLRPERVFDDGTFTYFQFRDAGTLPAVFVVDEDGNESLANFTVQGPYLVVSRTSRQFTLRDGVQATCIFNDHYPENSGTQATAAVIEEMPEKHLAGNIPLPAHKPDTGQTDQAQTGNDGSFLTWLRGKDTPSSRTLALNN